MSDLVPFVLDEEVQRIKSEISSRNVPVIFDGAIHDGETLAILVRFISDDCCICRLQLLARLMSG